MSIAAYFSQVKVKNYSCPMPYSSDIEALYKKVKGCHLCMTPSGKLEEDSPENENNGHPYLSNFRNLAHEEVAEWLSQFKPIIGSSHRQSDKNMPPLRAYLHNNKAVYSWLPLTVEQLRWVISLRPELSNYLQLLG